MDNQNTASTVKQLRASTGLSQEKFSRLVHIPAPTLQTWEQGTRNPPEYVVFLLTEYLKNLPKQ